MIVKRGCSWPGSRFHIANAYRVVLDTGYEHAGMTITFHAGMTIPPLHRPHIEYLG